MTFSYPGRAVGSHWNINSVNLPDFENLSEISGPETEDSKDKKKKPKK